MKKLLVSGRSFADTLCILNMSYTIETELGSEEKLMRVEFDITVFDCSFSHDYLGGSHVHHDTQYELEILSVTDEEGKGHPELFTEAETHIEDNWESITDDIKDCW
jgi:hypothetical protein